MKKIITLVSTFFLIVSSMLLPTKIFAEESAVDLTAIDEIAQRRVDNGTTPGVTVLVKRGAEVLYNKSFGWSYLYDMGARLDNPIEAKNDTMYDLASVTKVMATTQAAMKLVDEGRLNLDIPVTNYLEGFGTNGKENITTRQLLTHTSGLPQWEPTFLYVNTREGERNYVNDLELMFEPGTYRYSDLGFYTLGFIIENISGQPLEDYLEENIYDPLGMEDTMYVPLENGVDPARIAATSWGNPYEWRMSNQRDWNVGYDTSEHQEAFDEFDGWRWYTLQGEPNDGNAGMAMEGVAGHAGLFSTASDLSILGDVLLNGGERNGIQLYSQETIDLFTSLQTGIPNRGLGWRVGKSNPGTGFVGDYATENTFAHDGFTGTQVVFHPDYDLQVIVLSNKQNYGPYDNYGSYYSTYALSREINNAVFEAILTDAEKHSLELNSEALVTLNNGMKKNLGKGNNLNGLLNGITKGNGMNKLPDVLTLVQNQDELPEGTSFAYGDVSTSGGVEDVTAEVIATFPDNSQISKYVPVVFE
jgi:CubicO group peptidase (beta-lactamase class C family)